MLQEVYRNVKKCLNRIKDTSLVITNFLPLGRYIKTFTKISWYKKNLKNCSFLIKSNLFWCVTNWIFLWVYNTCMEHLQFIHLLMVIWRDHHILYSHDPLKQTAALAAAQFSLNYSAAWSCLAIVNPTLFVSWTLIPKLKCLAIPFEFMTVIL